MDANTLAIRAAAWKAAEIEAWTIAVQVRGLHFFSLDRDMQVLVYARLRDLEDPRLPS